MTGGVATTILPREFGSPPLTLSEVLLDLPAERTRKLRLDAPLIVNDQGVVVPTTFVVSSEDNPLLALRERTVNRLLELPPSDRKAAFRALFPPEGDVGSWDVRKRLYRTRYMMPSALGPPRISRDLAREFDLQDALDFWACVQRGELCPFNEMSLSARPPDLEKPWAFRVEYPGCPFPYSVSVAYRGCHALYEYPLRASAFRRFGQANAAPYDALKRFVLNLVTELTWSLHRVALHQTEAESLVQHYKLLPWTYMTDFSYDINVAKAFACPPPPSQATTPTLYKILLLNIDEYELGAGHISSLPFRRPASQKAVSLVGLNGLMQDPLGVVVSLTEHIHHFGPGSLEAVGGEGFVLGGQSYDSLWLDDSAYQAVNGLLFPREPDETCVLFQTIITKLRAHVFRFGLPTDAVAEVVERLAALEVELDVPSAARGVA
ncbi:MAG: FRG domain-containing protein [Planctomycetota bacterium]